MGPVAPPGHARVRGGAGVYTNWWKWPLSVVLGHLCTLLRLARVMRESSGGAGVYTNRRKWPLGTVLGHSCTLLRLATVMRASVGTQECTQIGGNGLSASFWGIRVHCCDSRGSRTSGAAASWRLCRGSNPHKPPRSPLWRLDNKYRDPSAQGSVAFGSSGASGASRDAPGSLSGPCRTTSTTFSHRTYPAHMRAKRTIVETLLSTLNLMSSQTPR